MKNTMKNNTPPIINAEPQWWVHHDGESVEHRMDPEVCNFRLTEADKAAGWTEEPLYTATQVQEFMVGWCNPNNPDPYLASASEMIRGVLAGNKTPATSKNLPKQEPLGDDFQRVLDENIWDLYETTPSPPAAPPKSTLLKKLCALSEQAYCDYIAQLKSDECLGWEYKTKTGKFCEPELKAHVKAGELLGRHRAFADAVNALFKEIGQKAEDAVQPVEGNKT